MDGCGRPVLSGPMSGSYAISIPPIRVVPGLTAPPLRPPPPRPPLGGILAGKPVETGEAGVILSLDTSCVSYTASSVRASLSGGLLDVKRGLTQGCVPIYFQVHWSAV